MADTLARINLLTDLKATLESATEDGTPGIATDYAHRLGWLSGGSWKWGALRGGDEEFATIKPLNIPAGYHARTNASGVLVQSAIQENDDAVVLPQLLRITGIGATQIPVVHPSGEYFAPASFTDDGSEIAFGVPVTFQPVTREAIIQPLPITNSAPGVVTVVSGGMKSFGFDGNTVTEELFYHCDLQHDYIADGDMLFHVHWMPATASGGDVKFQVEYQWTEAGATWGAPSTLSAVVAAGTTAWADKRTDITIPGTGHTYNSRLMIRLFRVPTDAADTYTGDAVLSSVGMHYQADPGQP